MNTGLDTATLAALVQPDRVHRRVYEDSTIFALELERIFGRAWVYVGHESEVAAPGAYVTRWIGAQPVLLCRHDDGSLHVLYNRCGHRGALVCNEARGNTGKRFRCPYHGWSFETDGRLHAVPLRQGYSDAYDLEAREFGMMPVARMASYRGFVFASLAARGPAFALPRAMSACIDAILDRAPDGEIEVTGGVHRYRFAGNWKAQLENALDHYHPPYGHASTMRRDGRQFSRRVGEQQGSPLADPGGGASVWDQPGMWAYPGGHGYEGPMPGAESAKSGVLFERYRVALHARHGAAQAERILSDEPFHNAVFYPNMNVQLRALYIRLVRPLAPDRTDVDVFPIRLKGAPEEMFQNQIRFLNLTHSAGSLIQTDDMEMFRRVQVGLAAERPEWVVLGRGFGRETTDGEGLKGTGTSELAMRSQFQAWRRYMSEMADDAAQAAE